MIEKSTLAFAILLLRLSAAVNYTYDPAGRLIKVDYGTGAGISYTYDKAGNILTRAVTGSGGPQISAGGVVHGASFQHTVAPGSLASVFGINFANGSNYASGLPLPTSLAGVSATVNGVSAPLVFANDKQINLQIPFETAPGSASVIVTVNGVKTGSEKVTVAAVESGIFTFGNNRAVVQNSDHSTNDANNPAKVGSVVVVYGTGQGQLNHPLPDGTPAASAVLSKPVVPVTATIGGTNAEVQFAGMTPGLVAVLQVNIKIPDMPSGTYPLVIQQGTTASNNPQISVTR